MPDQHHVVLTDDAAASSQYFQRREGSDVVLRVQCLSARDMKEISVLGTLLQLFVLAVTIIFIVLEATDHATQHHKRASVIASAGVAFLGLALTLVLAGMLLRGTYDHNKASCRWRRRAKKLVIIIAASVGLLMLACALWVTTSLYAVVGNHTCRMYAGFCKWSYAVQWTLLNLLLLVQLVLAHVPTTWKAPDGQVFQHLCLQRVTWLESAPDHAIVFDAPWHAHIPKLLPWLIIEASIITQLIGTPAGQAHACRQGADMSISCTYGALYTAHKVLAYVGIGVYLLYHIAYVRLGRKHATIAPYFSFRIGLVMMRIQEGTFYVSSFLVACVAWILATVFQPSPCVPCFQTGMYIVLILQGLRLTITQTALFAPKSFSATKPIPVKSLMHRFVWTEDRHHKHVRGSEQRGQDVHPLFCFETAIKLLYWCALVYEFDEGRKVEKLSKEIGMQLVGVTEMRLMRCEAANVKLLVAWGHGSLLLAFRGTANFTNAVADIKAWMVEEGPQATYHFVQPRPKVHSGFHNVWELSGLRQQVMEFVTSRFSEDRARHINVLLTGHSLGGAMANLAALDLAKLLPWASLKVYTVGAPRAGNHAYATEYNKHVPDSWAIINYRDPVPKMAKFGFLYARPGQKVLLMPHGDMVVCPTPLDVRLQGFRRMGRIANHKLASYRAALVHVVHSQLKEQRLQPDTDLVAVMGLADNPALKVYFLLLLQEALLKADTDLVYKSMKPVDHTDADDTESTEASEGDATSQAPCGQQTEHYLGS